MEYSRLLIKGLEFDRYNVEERDAYAEAVFSLIDLFHTKKVILHLEEGFTAHTFSFGDYQTIYLNWANFKSKSSLEGISQRTYQLMHNVIMSHPKLGTEIMNEEWDQIVAHKCNYGLPNLGCADYVSNQEEWHNDRILFFTDHHDLIIWDDVDGFLPNKEYSSHLLYTELQLHACASDIKIDDYQSIAIRFHDKVMRHKGPGIKAYTEEIGCKICCANFYVYEDLLSREEKRACGSARSIFSIINKDGNKQYISLDFKHGFFEFFDHHGVHLGEYNFNGFKNSPAEDSHHLKTI